MNERVPLNSQWLVLRIGGAEFLHCLVTDSIYRMAGKFDGEFNLTV